MNVWGRKSKKVLATLDPRLQVVMNELLLLVDVSLISGYRDREEQTILFENGLSKARYPDSKHNRKPSLAVDLQPAPYPKSEKELWAALGLIAGLAICIAASHGWRLRWGGDWNMNGSVVDNGFDDLFHLEMVE